MTSATESVRYYRKSARVLAVFAMVAFLLGLAVALAARSPAERLWPIGVAIAFGAIAIWQGWHNYVILTPAEVVVRNNLETLRIPWEQVSTAGREAAKLVGEQVVVYTTDRRTVPCQAFVGWSFGKPLGHDLVEAIKLRVGQR